MDDRSPLPTAIADGLQRPDLVRRQAYVAGRWCDADAGETIQVTDPATGEVVGSVPACGAAETRRAIEAAQAAQPAWAARSAEIGRASCRERVSTIV